MRKTVDVILRNDFHGTKCSVKIPANVRHHTVSRSTYYKICRDLCGSPTCTCGQIRGYQDVHIDVDIDIGPDGRSCDTFTITQDKN